MNAEIQKPNAESQGNLADNSSEAVRGETGRTATASDREQLEFAAKAVGIAGFDEAPGGGLFVKVESQGTVPMWNVWNPLKDDGDALRLAVKLRIDLQLFSLVPESWRPQGIARAVVDRLGQALGVPVENGDTEAATRRAIVRAAAEIGRSALAATDSKGEV